MSVISPIGPAGGIITHETSDSDLDHFQTGATP